MKPTHGMVLWHAQKTISEVINLAVAFDNNVNPILFPSHIA